MNSVTKPIKLFRRLADALQSLSKESEAVNKSYLDLLATSRIRPKMVAYFVNHDAPITTRKLASIINEDAGAIGHLIREFLDRKFIKRNGRGYVLASINIKSELIVLSKEAQS